MPTAWLCFVFFLNLLDVEACYPRESENRIREGAAIWSEPSGNITERNIYPRGICASFAAVLTGDPVLSFPEAHHIFLRQDPAVCVEG